MITAINSNLNFGAKKIRSPIIISNSCGKQNNAMPVQSFILEINTKKPDEIEALQEAVETWASNDPYGSLIVSDAARLGKYPQQQKINNKIFAVTTQSPGFSRLDSSKIVGLSEVIINDNGSAEIKFLHTTPEKTAENGVKKYNKIGKNFINMLKEAFSIRRITVQAAYSAATFYEAMGFRIIDTDKLIYVWQKDKKLAKLEKFMRQPKF